MMRLLCFSTLFPNAAHPQHGIFVETRLRQLLASGQAEATVVAPVPWFPSSHPGFGRYARFARVPAVESRHGMTVLHPRYPLIPKLGMTLAPFLLATAVRPVLARLLREGTGFDLIDAHYFYPDGVAAVLLARHFGRPVVVTARGSDLNLLPQYRLPRRMIQWATARADALITVSESLRQALIGLGAQPGKVQTLRNGVDLQLFHPSDRKVAREKLGAHGLTLLSVGNLIPAKGHALVVEAMQALPDAMLLIAGDGPARASLQGLAARLDVARRVHFLGPLPQQTLVDAYNAADVLVLASEREGWPNVLLEAMACGAPVIASRVGGTPEILSGTQAARLLDARSADAIARSVRALAGSPDLRLAARRHAEAFSWEATTAGQLQLFSRLVKQATNLARWESGASLG